MKIQYDTIVPDLEMSTIEGARTITGIKCRHGDGEETIRVGERDLVFVTTGSMTEDTAYGDDNTVPQLRDMNEPGPGSGWELWKNLAQKSEVFGRPEKFCGDIPVLCGNR